VQIDVSDSLRIISSFNDQSSSRCVSKLENGASTSYQNSDVIKAIVNGTKEVVAGDIDCSDGDALGSQRCSNVIDVSTLVIYISI